MGAHDLGNLVDFIVPVTLALIAYILKGIDRSVRDLSAKLGDLGTALGRIDERVRGVETRVDKLELQPKR